MCGTSAQCLHRYPAFRKSVGMGSFDGSGDNVAACGLENGIKSVAKRAIIIIDQEAQGLFSLGKLPNQLPGLLSDPDLIGISGYTGKLNAVSTQFDEKKAHRRSVARRLQR